MTDGLNSCNKSDKVEKIEKIDTWQKIVNFEHSNQNRPAQGA